jgi:hypothetical protein
MNLEYITLENGKNVRYIAALTFGGVDITVTTKLTKEEKAEFKHEIVFERDVVGLTFS